MREFLRNLFGVEGGPSPEEVKKERQEQGGGGVLREGSSERRRTAYVETPEEAVLKGYEKGSTKTLYGGTNETIFVELTGDGAGIFKPQDGEVELHRKSVRPGTYFRRERAAYFVDRFLDFNLVPPTVIREIDGRIGSFQKFIGDARVGFDTEYKKR